MYFLFQKLDKATNKIYYIKVQLVTNVTKFSQIITNFTFLYYY